MYVLLIVVCPFVLFILVIVLSVLLRYTDSDYHFISTFKQNKEKKIKMRTSGILFIHDKPLYYLSFLEVLLLIILFLILILSIYCIKEVDN